MANFKITNITDTLGKRDIGYNKVLDVDYMSGLERKIVKLNPSQTIFLSVNTLPISLHKLRLQKYVIIDEINNDAFNIEESSVNKKQDDAITTDSLTEKKIIKTKK